MEELKERTGREELHRRIIKEAGEAFRLHGIRSVRMDDIAAQVGISKRTLYEEFADKESLLLELLTDFKNQMQEQMQERYRASENVLEVMLHFIKLNIEILTNTNPKYFEDMKRYPSLMQHFRADRAANFDRSVAFMRQGVEQKLFRDDIDLTLYLKVQQSVFDCSLQSLCTDYPLGEVYRTTVLIFLRGISTPKGARMIEAFLKKK